MEYTLSFYAKENKPYIKHPKGFKFWKKSKLIENKVWVRKIVSIEVKEHEEAMNFFDNEKLKEVLSQMHDGLTYLQLEVNESGSSNYIKN